MRPFFAGCPKGLEELLRAELEALGAMQLKQTIAGVNFEASWPDVYRMLIHSRLAGRLLTPIRRFPAPDPETLYTGARALAWDEHLDVDTSFAIDATVSRSAMNHSKFAALKLKDAVVDFFRDTTGKRPDVNRDYPDVRINLHIFRDEATVSIDLGGGSLHERGYRKQTGAAPLKENLAAAILIRAGWPQIAAQGGSLVDPMCGSGTFLIEGLMMAADIAPNLKRDYFGIQGWKQFDGELWQQTQNEAEERARQGLAKLAEQGTIFAGFDTDNGVLQHARDNAATAGFAKLIQFGKRDVNRWQSGHSGGYPAGLVMVNPPYGERLGDLPELPKLYEDMGKTFVRAFKDWNASVITGNPNLAKQMGLRAVKKYKLYNGAIPCELLNFTISDERIIQKDEKQPLTKSAEMVANRLRKNQKALRKWLKAEAIEAYRLYDADLPEYNAAVDIFGDHVVVSEYAPPKNVDLAKSEARLLDLMRAVETVLEVPSERLTLKQRKKGRSTQNYGRMGGSGKLMPVREGQMSFLINPRDYLDVGLFNDHRPMRRRILETAGGKDFLNLFAYTGSVTVAAALGGARSTTTVDLSNTYLDWAEKNMAHNHIEVGVKHRVIRADVTHWIKEAAPEYDLIFLDPPTFSNSKNTSGTWDVQRDHVFMIKTAARLLRQGGLLYFSTNFRRFKLDNAAFETSGLKVTDITPETIPQDYARNPKIHLCFEVRWKV